MEDTVRTGAWRGFYARIGAGERLEITDFPYYLKKCFAMSFWCRCTAFTALEIGKGYMCYRGSWLEITQKEIRWHRCDGEEFVEASVSHHLTIAEYVGVSLSVDEDSLCRVHLHTVGSSFTTVFPWRHELNGPSFAANVGEADFTEVSIGMSSADFRRPVWMFGDSYFGVTDSRVIGQLKNLGFLNALVDGLAGQGSAGAYADLCRALRYGCPQYLVWCLGMNDSDAAYAENLEKVKELCCKEGITLILAKIPTVPERSKEILNEMVEKSECRYIDFYKAVGTDASGNWLPGYLFTDRVHPTEAGARALAMRILVDFPEIMQF